LKAWRDHVSKYSIGEVAAPPTRTDAGYRVYDDRTLAASQTDCMTA
jgi:hypothetical protein